MILIDTTDARQVYEYKSKKEELQSQIKDKGYTADDFALIRTTDYLEEDHILKAICKVPFVTNLNNVPATVMYRILMEQYNFNIYNDEEDEKLEKLNRIYSPLSTQYRSTIHFALNGLVSSHTKGNFDNKNFIIIDKLSHHLGKDDIRSIRMEDTFINGEVPLSNDAIVLINEQKYKSLIEQYPWISTYNIILYRGDEKMAVEMLLTSIGIVAEKIETHSAAYSERTQLYNDFFDKVSKDYDIEQDKHCYSKEYREDDEKNLIIWEIYERDFYNKLFNYFNIDTNAIEYLTSLHISEAKQEELFKNIILKIGVDKYKQFVLEYNKEIMTAINEGIYPTNEEILTNNQIIYHQQPKKMR